MREKQDNNKMMRGIIKVKSSGEEKGGKEGEGERGNEGH